MRPEKLRGGSPRGGEEGGARDAAGWTPEQKRGGRSSGCCGAEARAEKRRAEPGSPSGEDEGGARDAGRFLRRIKDFICNLPSQG